MAREPAQERIRRHGFRKNRAHRNQAPIDRLDAQLIAEEARVTRAVKECTHAVWRTLRRLGVHDTDAEDCAQVVFAIFARRVDDVAEGTERAFMLGTAVRIAADYRRSQRRKREEVVDLSGLDPSDEGAPSPESLLDRKRDLETLNAVLAQIPAARRAVLVLFELEGLTVSEIADVLRLPQGTVGSRLHRARREFDAICRRAESRR